MNITAIDQALAELKQDRARIDRAIDGLNAIAELHGLKGSAEPETVLPPPTALKRSAHRSASLSPRGKRRSNGKPSCEKHPDNREFNASGKCRVCLREYMREWARKKAKDAGRTVTPRPAARRESPPAEPTMLRCPSCPEKFPNARALGVHQSREHFGASSGTGSSLGGL